MSYARAGNPEAPVQNLLLVAVGCVAVSEALALSGPVSSPSW